MSLQICPNCKKHIQWWKIYKKLNEKRIYSHHIIDCQKCGYKLWTKKKNKDLWATIYTTLLWMLLPIILITFVATNKLNFLIAILIVIVYHFAIMTYYISNSKYKYVRKK